jgi:uncharacterized protein
MKLSQFKYVTLAIALLILWGCGQTPEDARMKLGQMNVPFNEDSFVERAHDGDIVAVKLFLQAGMKPNVTNSIGEPPLVAAAVSSRLEVAETLLAHGADPNAKDKKFGATPLIWAAAKGNPAMVTLLLAKGADIKVKDDKEGMTALMSAAVGGKADVVKMFLDKSEINATDNNNRTALAWAANFGRTEAARVLLDHGADTKPQEKETGWTALITAAANGKTEVVKLLVDKGANLNQQDRGGRTALMWALQKGHRNPAIVLLDKGADVNIHDLKGTTALDLARQHKQKIIEERLLKAGAIPGTAPTPAPPGASGAKPQAPKPSGQAADQKK